MAGVNGKQIEIIPYDTSEIDFVSPIKRALNIDAGDELAYLHQTHTRDSVVTLQTDSISDLHQAYYDKIGDTEFYDRYQYFIHEVVSRVLGEDLIVQKIPTFRVHLPGNKAVGEYHYDSDFGHQEAAVNFWVPVTDAYDTNTIHIVPEGDTEAHAINVKYGEVLMFDAVGLYHGNEINQTDVTRVSFDFRVIPRTNYVDSDRRSVNTLTRLALGDYYIYASEM